MAKHLVPPWKLQGCSFQASNWSLWTPTILSWVRLLHASCLPAAIDTPTDDTVLHKLLGPNASFLLSIWATHYLGKGEKKNDLGKGFERYYGIVLIGKASQTTKREHKGKVFLTQWSLPDTTTVICNAKWKEKGIYHALMLPRVDW